MTLQELFSSEARWTQKKVARNKDGQGRFPNSPEAVQWCLVGGIDKCYDGEELILVHHKVKNYLGMSLTIWNDYPDRTFADIRRVIEDLNI